MKHNVPDFFSPQLALFLGAKALPCSATAPKKACLPPQSPAQSRCLQGHVRSFPAAPQVTNTSVCDGALRPLCPSCTHTASFLLPCHEPLSPADTHDSSLAVGASLTGHMACATELNGAREGTVETSCLGTDVGSGGVQGRLCTPGGSYQGLPSPSPVLGAGDTQE